MKYILLSIILISVGFCENSYYAYGNKITLTPTKSIKTKGGVVAYYKDSRGNEVGVTNEILIECADESQCHKLFTKYGITQSSQLSTTLYLLKTPQNKNPFDLSRELHGEGGVTLSHPNFIRKKERR